jgi:DNA-binding response OmpR family regulator
LTDIPIILVVEGDDAIQGHVQDALSKGGFKTAIAGTGEEAVTLLKGGLVTYRALITDIILRGRCNGWEVARAAREIDPNFPVVYTSGLAGDKWPVQGVPNSLLLRRPFARAQLVTAVSQLTMGRFPDRSDLRDEV